MIWQVICMAIHTLHVANYIMYAMTVAQAVLISMEKQSLLTQSFTVSLSEETFWDSEREAALATKQQPNKVVQTHQNKQKQTRKKKEM